ncbi:glycosyltransferase [Azospirillum sp. TSH100]|uniref:glycosyltransferase n=1 Tax=Azospirillum sp. TSH100 TaxID=652764 RepID=UPI00130488D1|nr:glycosyltransferase [Azospirillum sp. TSH100]
MLFDLTCFLSNPSRGGVQRTMAELMHHWPKDRILVPAVVDEKSTMHMISFDVLKSVEALFQFADEGRDAGLSRELVSYIDNRLEVVTESQIDACDGILLVGVACCDQQIGFYETVVSTRPGKLYAICHESDPLPGAADSSDGHVRILRRLENIAFSSRGRQRDFEALVAKRNLRTPIIIGGGADAIGDVTCTPDSRRPEFVCVGTVARRNNHFLVLDLFETMWKSGLTVRLTFVGQAGAIAPQEVERLEALCRDQPLFSWERCVSDGEMGEILRYATGLLYLGEGFGLPVLEGLRAGIPAIVSKTLPALETALGGVLAIDVGIDTLAAAVRSLLDPEVARARRQDIDRSRLPGWGDVTAKVAGWVHGSGERAEPETGLDGQAASPVICFRERFETARAIDRILGQDGPAFIDACFVELFGRRARGSEMAGWSRTAEKVLQDKLDLLLLIASSDEFIQARGAGELRKWIRGVLFHRAHPGLPYDMEPRRRLSPDDFAEAGGLQELTDPVLEECLQKYQTLLKADIENFVELCFHLLLDRPAEESFRKGYMDWLATRQTPEARKLIIKELATSPFNRERKSEAWLACMEALAEIDVFDPKQVFLHKELQTRIPSRSLFRMLMSLDDAAFIRFSLRVDFGPRDGEVKPLVLVPEHPMEPSVKAKYLLYLATLAKEARLTNGVKSWLGRIAFP